MRARGHVLMGLIAAAVLAPPVEAGPRAESFPARPSARAARPKPARTKPAPPRTKPAPPPTKPASSRTTLRLRPRTSVRIAPPRIDTSQQAVALLYQRVGHGLRELQELRGVTATFELWPRFRAIQLDAALATPAARAEALAELGDLRLSIDRGRGIELSADCLNNPLVRADLTPTSGEPGAPLAHAPTSTSEVDASP